MTASRYRCAACGNLTRFDVTTTRRTRAYHHYTVGGELQVEDLDVLSEQVEEVSCRWCGTGSSVIEVSPEDAAQLEASADTDGTSGGSGAVTPPS